MTTTLDTKKNPLGVEYWLSVNNKTVSYALVKIDYSKSAVFLETIETRMNERNKGFAKQILEEIKNHQGVDEISCDSGFTRDGQSFISSKVKTENVDETDLFPEMTFVANWNTKISKYN